MRCARCGGLLALVRAPRPIYRYGVRLGQLKWETTRCAACDCSWHRRLLGSTGLLRWMKDGKLTLSLGTALLDELSPIPKRIATEISGKNEITVRYKYDWWWGEKQPRIVFTEDTVTFMERSDGWREQCVQRATVESITCGRMPKTRLFSVDMHTTSLLCSVLEIVSEAEATWMGRMLSLWSDQRFYEPSKRVFLIDEKWLPPLSDDD